MRSAAIRALLVQLGFLIGRVLPRRRRVVLATSHADRIAGNLVWIRDGLRRAMPDLELIELSIRLTGGLRGRARGAMHLVLSGYHLARARVFIVDDYFYPMYVVSPPPRSTWVQVWHGCGAFKKFGYSVLDKSFGATEAFVDRVAIHSNYDLCLVSAERFIPAYAEAFRLPPERFTSRLGIPRTDLFFDEARVAAAAAEVRQRYSIPPGRRVVLYAPTFRGERIARARSPVDLDLATLREALGEDHVVLLRAHPFVRTGRRPPVSEAGFVIDVSDHPDINELMLVSDVLVTDYSSAIYEFALLGRPIAFFAPDHVAYEAERGFYFDFATGVPGPIFSATEDLVAWLRAGDFDDVRLRVRRFAAESFDIADGRATARFVDDVIRPAVAPGSMAQRYPERP